jgi:hypothetical protein
MVGLKNLADAQTASSVFPADGLESDSRRSCHTGYIPSRNRNWGCLSSVHQKCQGSDSHHGGGSGQNWKQSHPPWKERPSSILDDLRKHWGGTVMSKFPEQRFQPLDFRIRITRSIP